MPVGYPRPAVGRQVPAIGSRVEVAAMDETHRRVIAEFDSPEAAGDAATALEAKGIDAAAIRLISPLTVPTPDATTQADAAVLRRFAPRAVTGGVLLGLLGAVIGVIVVAVIGGGGVAGGAMAAFAGLFIFGGLGAYWGITSRLPINEAAYDTALVDRHQPVTVEVKLLRPQYEDVARKVFESGRARRVEQRA
jgi:hypothetical protein